MAMAAIFIKAPVIAMQTLKEYRRWQAQNRIQMHIYNNKNRMGRLKNGLSMRFSLELEMGPFPIELLTGFYKTHSDGEAGSCLTSDVREQHRQQAREHYNRR